jgi:HEAT repeat protein
VSQVSQLSPELSRSVLHIARALLAAVRNWTLYPAEHPAVQASADRFAAAIRESTQGAVLTIGVMPETLLIEGAAADSGQTGIAEAAAMLHDRDIIAITFTGHVPTETVQAFLRILALDPGERRRRGGPARIWADAGDSSLIIEQIDYEKMLAREEAVIAEPARRDDLWRSIVTSIVGGHKIAFDRHAQERLLAISTSAHDIGDLAVAVAAPKCTIDGSPMITSQAATVLAAFRHLSSIVSVMSPDRLPELMTHLATAATQLDPHVIMQVMQSADDAAGVPVVAGMAAAFDDVKVAQLLATALALDGHATDRLATIFNTIAPDEDRKRRVLTLARSLLSETDFGRSGQFQGLWASTEELLVSYNDAPFVSETYRNALDGASDRAERLAGGELPAELPEWLESLGQANVRALSVTLLIDLFTLEQDAQRAAEIAPDLSALAEDLLMSGDYSDALTVTRALQTRAATPKGIGREACRFALDQLGESLAMREAAALIGDLDATNWEALRVVIETIGAASVEALKPVVAVEHDDLATGRAEGAIVDFGQKAVLRLASMISHDRWFVRRRGARLLGRIGRPEAVPLLQPLLRQQDPRVAHEAVVALGLVPDPAAARAIHTVLRAATGEVRRAVIDALVAGRDPRVVPMLVRILQESQPLGKDHDVVLETIDALGIVGTDASVAILATMAQRTRFLGGKKLRALKGRSVAALVRVNTDHAAHALTHAAEHGDRYLKKLARSAR